nr:MAG TPA: hypothetical protein [Myoviridae sp. ctfuG5]
MVVAIPYLILLSKPIFSIPRRYRIMSDQT